MENIIEETENTIRQIYDNAVANISEDADHPIMPPEYWQKAYLLMRAAPKLLAAAKLALNDLVDTVNYDEEDEQTLAAVKALEGAIDYTDEE